VGLTEVTWNGLDWIYLAQERKTWWVLVTAIWKLRVPSDGTNSCLVVEISAFQNGVCSTELVISVILFIANYYFELLL
jgi:hypothetical protein